MLYVTPYFGQTRSNEKEYFINIIYRYRYSLNLEQVLNLKSSSNVSKTYSKFKSNFL